MQTYANTSKENVVVNLYTVTGRGSDRGQRCQKTRWRCNEKTNRKQHESEVRQDCFGDAPERWQAWPWDLFIWNIVCYGLWILRLLGPAGFGSALFYHAVIYLRSWCQRPLWLIADCCFRDPVNVHTRMPTQTPPHTHTQIQESEKCFALLSFTLPRIHTHTHKHTIFVYVQSFLGNIM